MLLHEHLENKLDKQPDFLFSEFQGKQITYREANTLCNKLAHSLISAGLKKGDRFAFLSKNSSEMAFMYYAASKVGIVPVPLNYRLADQEWEYIVNDSQSKIMIIRGNEYCERIKTIYSHYD